MIVLCAIGILIAAYAGGLLYVSKAREYLTASEKVWDDLYDAAEAMVRDPEMPGGMVGFAAASVMCAGCGCLTGQILRESIRRIWKKRPLERRPADPRVTDAQRAAFARVVALAVYYDSLRAPFLGFVLRRLVMPWIVDAAGGKPAPKRKLALAAEASRHAMNDKPEARKVLALA